MDEIPENHWQIGLEKPIHVKKLHQTENDIFTSALITSAGLHVLGKFFGG